MIKGEKYCAKCTHFTLQELPSGTAPGHGRCTMFEKSEPHLAIVAWDTPFCAVYTIAKKMSTRQEWIAKQQPTEGK